MLFMSRLVQLNTIIMPPVAFFGSSIHSLPALKALKKAGYLIKVVVSQPPRPVGRQKILTPTPVAEFAKRFHIPLITPLSQKNNPLMMKNPDEFCRQLKKYRPDMLIVVYFGQKIPQSVLKLTKHGGLNIHPSHLPKYRGASPVQWAILFGEKETGVSIVKMTIEIDAGPIITQEKEPIFNDDTAPKLMERLSQKGANLLIKILPRYLIGALTPKLQGASPTVNARRLTRDDGFIPQSILKKALAGKPSFKLQKLFFPNSKSTTYDSLSIEQMVRAFTPWPGVWTKVKIKTQKAKRKTQRLKILKAHLENDKLVLDRVQLEGKKPVSYDLFKQGYPEIKLKIEK